MIIIIVIVVDVVVATVVVIGIDVVFVISPFIIGLIGALCKAEPSTPNDRSQRSPKQGVPINPLVNLSYTNPYPLLRTLTLPYISLKFRFRGSYQPYCSTLYHIRLYHIILYHIILYHIILYYIPHCITLYPMS